MLCFLCCYYLHFIHYSELLRASYAKTTHQLHIMLTTQKDWLLEQDSNLRPID